MKIKLISLVLLAAAASGCGVPRYLISDGFIGPRGEKTIVMPVASTDNKTVLYNYILRVCDIDAQGVESQCKDTTVLANVVLQSIY